MRKQFQYPGPDADHWKEMPRILADGLQDTLNKYDEELKSEQMRSFKLSEKLSKYRKRVGELSRELAEAKQMILELKNGR